MQKDLTLSLLRGNVWLQSVLLGLVLVFVFSLARPVGERLALTYAPTVFWITSCFALVLIFNGLYLLEQENQIKETLFLSPLIPQEIWLAKAGVGLVLLLLVQLVILLAVLVFLNQKIVSFSFPLFLFFLAIDLGLVWIGSLLGALSYGHEIKESFLSLLIFPLLIPLLLAGIKLGEAGLGASVDLKTWAQLTIAFDLIFLGGGFILFPFIFGGD